MRPTEQATWVAVEQVQRLVAQLSPEVTAAGPPLCVFDAWYDVAHFTQALADTPVALLIRLRSTRGCSGQPDPATQPPRGRRKRTGATCVCQDPVQAVAGQARRRRRVGVAITVAR